MRFGLFIGAKVGGRHVEDSMAGDSLTLDEFLDYVLLAEKIGLHNVFVVEHHFTGAGQISASLGLLSYLAALTDRIRLGTAVTVLPWHDPAILTEQAATLDLLSNGRFDFGIGKGYRPPEFKGFCVPMDEAQARFDECLAFIRKAWTTEGRFSFEGKWHRYEDIVVEPRPVQNPHPPFWLAAGSDKSAQSAGAGGFNMMLDQVSPVETIGNRIALYKSARSEAGLSTSSGEVCLARAFRVTQDEAETLQVKREMGTWLESVGALKAFTGPAGTPDDRINWYMGSDVPLIGTIDQISDRVEALQAAGAEHIILCDMAGSRDGLRIFGERVAPKFANAPEGAVNITAAKAA